MNEVLLNFSFSEYWEFHELLSTRICLHLCFYIVCPWLPLKAPFSYLTYKMVNHNIPRWNKWAAWLMYFRSNVLLMPFSFLQNTIGCQFLMMLTKYFRLTNYTWMFCEGYYLHRLLANTFEEERSLAFILSIGWGNNLVCIKVIRSLCIRHILQEFHWSLVCCMEHFEWCMTTKCVGLCLHLMPTLNGSTWHQD